jgi:hypothetical protein
MDVQKEPSEILSGSFLRNAFTWTNIRSKAGFGRLITVVDSTVVFDGCYRFAIPASYITSYRFTDAFPPCKARECFWISACAWLSRYLSMFAWLSHSE